MAVGVALTLAAGAAPALKIDAPAGTLTTRFLKSISITITNNTEADVAGLKVVRATLTGRDGVLDQRFLCLSPDGQNCPESVTVKKGVQPLFLMTRSAAGSEMPEGQYAGTVWLGDDAGNQYDFALKLAATSGTAVRAGILLLTLGAVLSWVVTRYLRGRSQRNDALLVALDVDETLSRLQPILNKATTTTTVQFKELSPRVAALRGNLTEKSLDKFLPPKLPLPWSAGRSTQYAAFITKASAETAALAVFIKSGISAIVARWDPADAALQAKIVSALADIDVGSVGVEATPPAQLVVNAALAKVRTLAGMGAKALPAQAAEPSFASIRVEQTATAAVFWLFWLIVTVLGGYAVLILYNPGFGETGDWLKCFLWGLGFNIAGGQVQGLTASSASTIFNVNVPKVVS